MKLSEFLKAVVPEGNMVIAQKRDGKKDGREFSYFHHTVCGSHSQSLSVIRRLSAENKDIYYALASFKQGFHKNTKGKTVVRIRDNVDQLKALWFDIDFKGGLSDPTQVVAALREFSKATGVPAPSILVHSGNGIHCYWPFTKAVPYEQWQRMADRLKELANEQRLPADLVCTGDACRVLRPPGTKNCKEPSRPKPVVFLYDAGPLLDPDALEQSLVGKLSGLPLVAGDIGAVPDYARALVEGVSEAVQDEFTGSGHTPQPVESLFSEIMGKCGVLKTVANTQGKECNEPEWTAVLQLLSHCQDGELFAHEVSKGHIDYTPESTNEKFEQRKENTAGPTLCKTFEGYHPETCKACPYYGKIKTPLMLGVEVTVKTPTGVIVGTWRPVPGGNGMERKMLNTETNQYEWVKVLRRQYDEIETSRSVVTRHYELHFKVKYHGAEDIDIVLPTGHLGNDHKLKETMANFGAPLQATELNPFKQFMGTWLEQLQGAREVAAVTEQLGWIRSGDESNVIEGFSAGAKSFMSDGSERKGVRIAKEFATLGRMYEPAGVLKPWTRVAYFLSEQNNPAFTATLASAFASPLLHFTGVQGGILSVVSPESGVGKSSALKCAQAVWGSPTHGMNSIDDTRLSVARKLGFLNNLPAYWDELRGRKTMEEFMVLAFQVSQGKEKSRLDSTATMREVNTWETMLIAASNESIFDYMGSYSVGSDAGVARTFELTIEPFETDKSRAEIAMLFEALNQNYGHAGQIYAKYLAENHESIKKEVANTFTKLSDHCKMRPAERFWFAIMSSLVVGAKLANRCGLVNIDTTTLVKFLVHNVHNLRGRSSSAMVGSTPAELIAAYMQQHQDKGLIVDHMKIGRGGATYDPIITSSPRADRIVYQLAKKDGIVRVAKGDFTTWLKRSKEINWSTVEKAFRTELKMVAGKLQLGLGTKWQLSRQICLDMHIDYNEEEIDV